MGCISGTTVSFGISELISKSRVFHKRPHAYSAHYTVRHYRAVLFFILCWDYRVQVRNESWGQCVRLRRIRDCVFLSIVAHEFPRPLSVGTAREWQSDETPRAVSRRGVDRGARRPQWINCSFSVALHGEKRPRTEFSLGILLSGDTADVLQGEGGSRLYASPNLYTCVYCIHYGHRVGCIALAPSPLHWRVRSASASTTAPHQHRPGTYDDFRYIENRCFRQSWLFLTVQLWMFSIFHFIWYL